MTGIAVGQVDREVLADEVHHVEPDQVDQAVQAGRRQPDRLAEHRIDRLLRHPVGEERLRADAAR